MHLHRQPLPAPTPLKCSVNYDIGDTIADFAKPLIFHCDFICLKHALLDISQNEINFGKITV